MVQEILTYLIVIVAVLTAVIKTFKKLKGKKHKIKTDFRQASMGTQHNCSDCSAECMLRNKINPSIQTEIDLCKTIEVKTKL